LQKFTLNALLAEGDTTHDWGYGLRGKLDLKGIIDANTIVKHYSKIGTEAARGRLESNSNPSIASHSLPARRPQQLRDQAHGDETRSYLPLTQVGAGDTSTSSGMLQIEDSKTYSRGAARDSSRDQAKGLISTEKGLKRKAENQFVVEGDHQSLGSTGKDIDVLRAYAKAAKKSKKGLPIKLGAKTGSVAEQASYLRSQLEIFFRDHNGGSNMFVPM
jgi:hypothetical protein